MHFQVWDIRNLFFPEFLIAPALRIANILGVSDTKSLLWSATFPIVLLASINVILVFQIAETLNADPLAAAFASLLYAFHWLPLGFGSTVYPRTASTCCILLISFKRRWNHAWGKSFFAGVLLSIAFAIRYSEIVFLFPLLIFAYLRNDHDRIPATAILIAGFCIGTVFSVGLEDSLTWGKWFSSLIAFAKFTLLQKESSSLSGHQPWYYYALRLPEWLSPFLLPFFWMYKKQKNELGIGYFILLPLCSISLIFHKELRYLQGIIPFVCLCRELERQACIAPVFGSSRLCC